MNSQGRHTPPPSAKIVIDPIQVHSAPAEIDDPQQSRDISGSSQKISDPVISQESLEATPGIGRTVSLAYLMSLNIGFTPEHLRLLKISPQDASMRSETPELLEKEPLSSSSVGRPRDATETSVSSASIPRTPLVDYASSSSDSTPASPQPSKNVPVATNRRDPSTLPVMTKEQTQDLVMNPITSSEISSAVPRSETLRRQREMIIGSQVYRNRYSHVAGSLVDRFKAMTVMEPTLTAVSTTTAVPVIVANSRPSTLRIQSSEKPKSISESQAIPRLFRPKFIPVQPTPSTIEFSSSVLTPRSINSFPEINIRDQLPHTKHSSRPSLPPHLRGKTANPDAGAAARAQYGRL